MRGRGVLLVVVFAFASVAFGACDDDDGGVDGSTDAARWEGTFDSTFGELTFRADGDQVTGTYEFCGGELEGTADGSRLTGEWVEDPEACEARETRSPDAEPSGTFDFTLSSDDSSFSGNWRYESGAKDPRGDDWEGTRVSDAT